MAVVELLIQGVDKASSVISGIAGPLASVGAIAAGVVVGGFATATVAAVNFGTDSKQAVDDLQARLGVTGQEAERLGSIAQTVFANNWYGSIGEATAAVGDIQQRLGVLADDDLAAVASGVAAISDTFGAESPKVVDAVKAIRDNFPGTTEQQALDLIASGFQNGLDASGDFLDTIGEYSNQFSSGGASVEQFFGLLDSGLGNGVLGTDKIADAFKEFNVRIQDGSKTTSDALNTLGLDNLLTDLNQGKITGADAMQLIVTELGKVDEATRRQTGVALLGTQFEDLGFDVSAFGGVAGTAFSDVGGSVDSLNVKYNNFGSLVEGLKRTFLVAVQPLVDQLLSLANEALPYVQSAFGWMQNELPPLIDQASAVIGAMVEAVKGWFGGDLNTTMTTAGGMFSTVFGDIQTAALAMQQVFSEQIMPILSNLATVLMPAAEAAATVLASAYENVLKPALQALWAIISEVVLPILGSLSEFLAKTLPPVIKSMSEIMTGTLLPALGSVYKFINESVLPIFESVRKWMATTIPPIINSLSALWTGTLKPALNEVWSFINANVIPIFKAVTETHIAGLKTATTTLSSLWTGTLKPALNEVWSFINGSVAPVLSTLAGTNIEAVKGALNALGTALTGGSGVKAQLSSVVSYIKDTAQSALSSFKSDYIDKISTAFGNITSAINSVISKLSELLSKLANATIPSWLKGNSPPPLADWFSYIAESAGAVNTQMAAMDFDAGMSQVRSLTTQGSGTRQATGQGNGATPITVHVYLDGKVIAQFSDRAIGNQATLRQRTK